MISDDEDQQELLMNHSSQEPSGSASASGHVKPPITNPPAKGPIDRFIRRFGELSHTLLLLALYAVAAIAYGLALAPALWFLQLCWSSTGALDAWLKWPLFGIACGLAFFIVGITLLIVIAAFNAILPTRVKPFKGSYYTYAALPWYIHNSLFYLVRYTFLPYVTLTPFGDWFLRAMGMKLGRRAFLNTEFISDPCMISIGEDAVIGGSVHLFAHYAGGGHLIIAPTIVGARATVGEKATLMGDVHVGEDATILPHSVLLPGSRVGPGETWGGVPAVFIAPEEWQRIKDGIKRT
jgi:acetyltransferase-like isoleucine patch superfamily enzyme